MKAKIRFLTASTIIILFLQACCLEFYVDVESKDKREPLKELGFQSSNIVLGSKNAILEATYPLPPMAVKSFEISKSGNYYLVGLESGLTECYQWAVKVIDANTGNSFKTIPQYNYRFDSVKMSQDEKSVAVLTVAGFSLPLHLILLGLIIEQLYHLCTCLNFPDQL